MLSGFIQRIFPVRSRPRVKKRPLIIAHRCGGGIAPENTLVALKKSIQLGVDLIEVDIQATADGQLVVIHDFLLDRTTNGSGGPIYIYDYALLKQLDAGYKFTLDGGRTYPYRGKKIEIPRLEQVLELYPQQKIIIEIKQYIPPIEDLVLQAIRAANAENRVIVCCFNHQVLKRFRKLAPDLAVSGSSLELKLFYLFYKLKISSFYPLDIGLFLVPDYFKDKTVLTEKFVHAVQNRGIKIFVWTINTEKEMQEMIRFGVDGIITDRPDLLQKLVEGKS